MGFDDMTVKGVSIKKFDLIEKFKQAREQYTHVSNNNAYNKNMWVQYFANQTYDQGASNK
jgi:hypothetical protein